MTCEVSAFYWVPPFAQGYVRDLRVRWALEEAGASMSPTIASLLSRPEPAAEAAASAK